jgi:hypothetical protein
MSNTRNKKTDNLINKAADESAPLFEQMLLRARIKELVYGKPYEKADGKVVQFLDPYDATRKETAILVLQGIEQELCSGNPSKETIAFICLALSKYRCGVVKTLDEAFYLAVKRPSGGAVSSEEKLRDTSQAYLDVVYSNIFIYEPGNNTPLREPLTQEIQDKALEAAYHAWRKFVPPKTNKDGSPVEIDIEKTIKDTIVTLLRNAGHYIETEQKSKNRKRGIRLSAK